MSFSSHERCCLWYCVHRGLWAGLRELEHALGAWGCELLGRCKAPGVLRETGVWERPLFSASASPCVKWGILGPGGIFITLELEKVFSLCYCFGLDVSLVFGSGSQVWCVSLIPDFLRDLAQFQNWVGNVTGSVLASVVFLVFPFGYSKKIEKLRKATWWGWTLSLKTQVNFILFTNWSFL